MADRPTPAGAKAAPGEHAPARRPGAGLTVPEVAARYRIGEDKVRALIRKGELAAINTSDTRCGKPRYVVLPEALAEFERRRAAATAAPTTAGRRRKRKYQVDYFAD